MQNKMAKDQQDKIQSSKTKQASATNEFVHAKFIKDYQASIQMIRDQSMEQEEGLQKLNFEQTVMVMKYMGFLPRVIHEGRTGYDLLTEFWDLVQGEARQGISAGDLFYMLEIIKGYRYPEREVEFDDMDESHVEEEEKVEDGDGDEEDGLVRPVRSRIRRYVRYSEEGSLVIALGGQIKIQQRFRAFQINTTQKDITNRNSMVSGKLAEKFDKNTQKPQISEMSQKLALNRRKRLNAKKESDIVDILYQQSEMKSERRQNKTMMDIEKAKELLEQEMTFKPKTNNYESHQPTSGDKCLDLFARVKVGQYANKRDNEENMQRNDQQEFEQHKALELNTSIFRQGQLEQIKGLDLHLKHKKQAALKKELELVATLRNPTVDYKVKTTKKGKKVTKKRSNQLYGSQTMNTGTETKFKTSFGMPKPVNKSKRTTEMAMKVQMRRPITYTEAKKIREQQGEENPVQGDIINLNTGGDEQNQEDVMVQQLPDQAMVEQNSNENIELEQQTLNINARQGVVEMQDQRFMDAQMNDQVVIDQYQQ